MAIVVLVLWGFVSFVKSNMPYTFNEVEAGTYGAVITMAEFDRIQTGMSYREVWSIIGTNGEQIGESSIAGHETESYSWKNPNGSNMIAMFQDGRLISKAQAGLRGRETARTVSEFEDRRSPAEKARSARETDELLRRTREILKKK